MKLGFKRLDSRGFGHHLLLAVIIVTGVAGFGAYKIYTATAEVSGGQPVKRPNIVFIVTDDQSLNLMRFMPQTKSLIADKGVSFNNYFDNISLCCAARASIFRGQYAHNTGVEDNTLPNGGFGKFYRDGLHKNNIATWLNDDGYETSLMGKYMNGYPSSNGAGPNARVANTYVPPGWTDWFVPISGSPYDQYGYTANVNGKLVEYGNSKEDYGVDVISNRAANYIRERKNSNKPYFMYISPYAPHSPYTPPERYKGTQKGLTYPATPDYNERDVSDKPRTTSTLRSLSSSNEAHINDVYQKRAESIRAVDDLVENVHQALKSTKQLDNTYVVFTSDNGYHMGEHRLDIGKYTPYETDIHLPLYIRGPGIKDGSESNTLAGNIDLAQTFADMAGARVPNFVDGQSLVPSIFGKQQTARKYYLLERQPSKFMGVSAAAAAGNPDETPDAVMSGRSGAPPPPYSGIRTNDGYTYVLYDDGQQEFYDMNRDQYQLNNLASPNANPVMDAAQRTVFNELRAKLPRLENCKGSACIQ